MLKYDADMNCRLQRVIQVIQIECRGEAALCHKLEGCGLIPDGVGIFS
jgi:hypothetical protein